MNKFVQPVNWSTLMISNCRKHFQSWKVFYNQFVGIVQSCYLQKENMQKCLRGSQGGFFYSFHQREKK